MNRCAVRMPAFIRRIVATLCMGAAAAVGAGAAEPPLREIRFEGPFPFSEKRAGALVALPLDEPFDPAAAQEASARLMEACRLRHYPFARVRWRAGPSEAQDGLSLVFIGNPGQRGRLAEVRFRGNIALEDEVLLRSLRVRPRPGWIARALGRDLLRLEHLAGDHAALREAYRQAGYWAAEIGTPDLDWDPSAGGFALAWPILDEGPLFRIGTLTLTGDPALSPRLLRRSLALSEGDIARPEPLRLAEEQLVALYRERGHAFAAASMAASFDDEAGRVDLHFTVQPGSLPRLRSIRIEGNTITRDAIVLREIPMKPGDPFDAFAARAALANLRALDLFDEADAVYLGGADLDAFDLSVRIREKPTGRFETGVSYGSDEGVAFLVQVSEHNLALRPPFRGSALQARLAGTFGPKVLRVEHSLRNPRLGPSRWSLAGNAFFEENRYASEVYDERRWDVRLLAGHPVGDHHLVSFGPGWTRYEILRPDTALRPAFADEPSNLDLSALLLHWDVLRLDRLLRPSRGVRVQSRLALGLTELGGDTEIIEAESRASLYLNPWWEHVVVLRGGIRAIEPVRGTDTVPLPLRVFLGGASDLRGFAYRSLSPPGADGRADGGQAAWWASAEYRLPILSWLDASAFFDVGDVSLTARRFEGIGPVSDGGIGLLIQAREFPVRFDVAFPFQVPPGDAVNEVGKARFSFSTGYAF